MKKEVKQTTFDNLNRYSMVHQQEKLSLFKIIRNVVIYIFFDLNNIHISCKEIKYKKQKYNR